MGLVIAWCFCSLARFTSAVLYNETIVDAITFRVAAAPPPPFVKT